MKNILLTVYRFILVRPYLFKLNQHIYKLQLRSMGILNSETENATGEPWFINKLSALNPKLLIDVGANDQAYGQKQYPQTTIFAFEPHPASFERLKKNSKNNVVPVNMAVGEKTGSATLWDFADDAPRKKDQPTSQLATQHGEIITDLYHQPSKKYSIRTTSLDDFFGTKKIGKIDLLKIDAEGNELAVIKGAQQLLKDQKIKIIQFEFNETHAYSHVLMKDFYDLLPDFTFFRLLPNGAVNLGTYRPVTHEIFGFQNIVAIHKHCPFKLD